MSTDLIHGFPANRRINDTDMLHRFNSLLANADRSTFQNAIWSDNARAYLPLVAVYVMDNGQTYSVFCTDTITTPTRYVMSLFVTRNHQEAMIVHSQMLHETIHNIDHPND